MLRRAPLAAALAALALAAVLAAPPAAAQDSTDAEAASTVTAVTTTLHPGWNMAAWLGEDAPVSAIFEAVPELDLVSAWDAEAQIERRARPRSVLRDGLTRLTAGMGLWLRVGGDEAVEWTQEPAAGGVLLELREGRNVVGWTGRDGILAAEALARFGDRLADASRWDAETDRFERYRPGAPEDANTLRALRRGDAIEVEMASDARWWQSGTARTAFEFVGDVPEERQAEIRAETAEVLAYYAERYGIVPPEFTVLVDPALDIAADAIARRIRIGRHIVDYPLIGGTIAHEYTHVLQHYLQGLPLAEGSSSPAWLIEGQATYAGGLFFQNRGDRTGDRQRSLWWQEALDAVPLPLRDLADSEPFYAEGGPAYALGALATEWLVSRAEAREEEQSGGAAPAPDGGGLTEHESHIRYWQAVPSPERWGEAFEATFGLTADAFYDEFEAYRADGLALLAPHRFDDRDGPLLVFTGDTPPEAEAAIREEFGKVRAFFSERFAVDEPDFTIYAVSDLEAAAPLYLRLSGRRPAEGSCGWTVDGLATIVILTCYEPPLHDLDRRYFRAVREQIAPWGQLPAVPAGRDPRGPNWLLLAGESYAEAAYRAATGRDTLDRIRGREVSAAARTWRSLRGLETHAGVIAAGYWEARALGFLAAERLVALAGEPALFAYYEALPDAAGWREAFEAAFGVTPEAFYADFDAYSAEAAPPLPHLADDREEPVLAFAGDVPAGTQAAVRAEFDNLRAFYAERFGTPEPDATFFVGPDAASLAATHLLAFGREIEDGFCDWASDAVTVIALDCSASPPYDLDWHYHFHVRSRLAPWGSLIKDAEAAIAEANEGHDPRGPRWLLLATERYAGAAYGAAAGREQLDRNRRIAFARRSARPLEDMETYAGADAVWPPAASALVLLAAERLVALTGEPALFAYYEALPDAAGWREAFEAAFGLTPAAFYADFEAYRAEAAPPFALHELRGVVLDPGGRPLAGVWIGAGRGEPDWEHTATTGEDGTFALRVRDGRYGLTLDAAASRCRPAGGNLLWDIARVGVAGAGVDGIVIRLPRGASCDPP